MRFEFKKGITISVRFIILIEFEFENFPLFSISAPFYAHLIHVGLEELYSQLNGCISSNKQFFLALKYLENSTIDFTY